MSLKKLWSALKGGTNEALEAAADTQALRILDQELREAKEELRRCDHSLTKIMAKRKLQENKIKDIDAKIAEYTTHALSANEQGNEALAIECAERVGELEAEKATEQSFLDNFQSSEKTLQANISKAKTNIRRMDQQVEQVKATEAVQKAQVAVSSRHMGANSKVKTAVDSLERLKKKQAERSAELEAASELAESESGSELDSKLKAAGIVAGGGANVKTNLLSF